MSTFDYQADRAQRLALRQENLNQFRKRIDALCQAMRFQLGEPGLSNYSLTTWHLTNISDLEESFMYYATIERQTQPVRGSTLPMSLHLEWDERADRIEVHRGALLRSRDGHQFPYNQGSILDIPKRTFAAGRFGTSAIHQIAREIHDTIIVPFTAALLQGEVQRAEYEAKQDRRGRTLQRLKDTFPGAKEGGSDEAMLYIDLGQEVEAKVHINYAGTEVNRLEIRYGIPIELLEEILFLVQERVKELPDDRD